MSDAAKKWSDEITQHHAATDAPFHLLQGEAARLPLADKSVALVIGSPPYAEKGQRYQGARKVERWRVDKWVNYMVRCTREGLRVSTGPVVWIVDSPVKNHEYIPAVERLLVELDVAGISLARPCVWIKNSPPCGGAKPRYFSHTYESVIVAKHPGPLTVFNWEAIATPPKYSNGGRFRQRGADGRRRVGSAYPVHKKLTNPRDVFKANVGGGQMGHPLAHENEAPFPVDLVEPLIKAFTPPGARVLDPFGGSGTTADAARRCGRCGISLDYRNSQCQLAWDRLTTPERNT